jgi:Type II secretion system (T2SS), protein G
MSKPMRWMKRPVFAVFFGLVVALLLYLTVLFFVQELTEQDKVLHVAVEVKSIEKAMEAYNKRFGVYPTSMDILCNRLPDGSPAILDQGMMLDPWGQPYIIDRVFSGEDCLVARRMFTPKALRVRERSSAIGRAKMEGDASDDTAAHRRPIPRLTFVCITSQLIDLQEQKQRPG